MDYLKPYINPEMFKYEYDLDKKKKEVKESDGTLEYEEHLNSEFDRQSKIGRATGKIQSSKEIREAIAQFQVQLDQNKRHWKISSDDPSVLG
jgi:hypothetical protein